MNKTRRILPVLAIALIIATVPGIASAQSPDSILQQNYFSNNITAAPDATVRITNDGVNGGGRGSFTSPGPGSLCAMIYVHSADQQLNECCGCLVTPNGLQTIDVKTQLTANTLTGRIPTDGVINVITSSLNANASTGFSATSTAGPQGNDFPTGSTIPADNTVFCDPTQNVTAAVGLHSWATHIQNKLTGVTGQAAYPETETRSDPSTLSAGELVNEEAVCGFDVSNGSGQGVCDCGKFEN